MHSFKKMKQKKRVGRVREEDTTIDNQRRPRDKELTRNQGVGRVDMCGKGFSGKRNAGIKVLKQDFAQRVAEASVAGREEALHRTEQ